MKDKFKSYKFWIGVIAAVIVLINTLGAVFKFSVNEVAITSIATAVLGVLVMLGFVKKDTTPKQTTDDAQNEQLDDKTNVDEIAQQTEQKIDEKLDELTKE